ncbi:MAG: tetratricopeptide repeat protein [Paludibacteraceae bacterium]|nr:tetratricopeptide repeat protein [Paludibacteraceae bacterium]
MKRSILFIVISVFVLPCAFAQKESKDVRAGNSLYKNEKYVDAEIAYRKGLDKNKNSFEANFNLGDALYKQGKYPEALQQFAKSASMEKNDKGKVAAAFHNIGNSLFKSKQYDKSINAYKASLKINSQDKQTRYNLALAQAMLKNQQQQNKNKKNDKDKKNKQDKQQQNKPDNKQGNKDQNKQPQPDNNMSKENAKQILDAFLQDEKDVQNRVKENQQKQAKKRNVEKDW